MSDQQNETPKRVERTDQELRQSALDLLDGKLFCSQQVDPDMIPSVFMPLYFLDDESHQRLKENEASVLFEEMSKAGPMSVNGYPCFMSFQYWTKGEWNRLRVFIDEARKVKEQFLKG